MRVIFVLGAQALSLRQWSDWKRAEKQAHSSCLGVRRALTCQLAAQAEARRAFVDLTLPLLLECMTAPPDAQPWEAADEDPNPSTAGVDFLRAVLLCVDSMTSSPSRHKKGYCYIEWAPLVKVGPRWLAEHPVQDSWLQSHPDAARMPRLGLSAATSLRCQAACEAWSSRHWPSPADSRMGRRPTRSWAPRSACSCWS